MLPGKRRARRRADRAFDDGVGVTRYQMRQELLSIGDDYWIEDQSGNHAFKVDGKALRARKTFHFEDPAGHRVATIRSRPLCIKDSMSIDAADGHKVAEVSKKWFRVRDSYGLQIGPDVQDATVLGAAIAIDTMTH